MAYQPLVTHPAPLHWEKTLPPTPARHCSSATRRSNFRKWNRRPNLSGGGKTLNFLWASVSSVSSKIRGMSSGKSPNLVGTESDVKNFSYCLEESWNHLWWIPTDQLWRRIWEDEAILVELAKGQLMAVESSTEHSFGVMFSCWLVNSSCDQK